MGSFHDAALPGLISLKSPFAVKETVDQLIRLVESKGLTVFCRVDHAAGAAAAGMQLRPTTASRLEAPHSPMQCGHCFQP